MFLPTNTYVIYVHCWYLFCNLFLSMYVGPPQVERVTVSASMAPLDLNEFDIMISWDVSGLCMYVCIVVSKKLCMYIYSLHNYGTAHN